MNVIDCKYHNLIKTNHGIYALSKISENIIHCIYSKMPIEQKHSYMIEPSVSEKSLPLEYFSSADKVIFKSDKINITINSNGEFVWFDRIKNSLILKESAKNLYEIPLYDYQLDGDKPQIRRVKTIDGERNFIDNLIKKEIGTAYRGKLNFYFQDDEAIYGLGQGEEGIYNYRHHTQYLYQHNMRIPIPFFISSAGYGILVDCGSLMTFHDSESGSYILLDTVDMIDYYFILGDSFDEIIKGFRELTGKAAMLPKWACGYIQSKEAYKTSQELLQVGQEYRKRNIPIDCIVQDWNTWVPGHWGEKILDPARYGDMKDVNCKLHNMNIHTMVSVWPNMNEGTEDYNDFYLDGLLLNDNSTYNAFSEQARKLYFDQLKNGLLKNGFDSIWSDSTEPFSGPDWCGKNKREPWERYLLVGNEHKKFLGAKRANLFALMHAKGVYENIRKSHDNKRILNLTRSGYPSQQKYGAVLWSGDICATWKELKKQIIEGINMCCSGMPYWTLDIGGFFTVKDAWYNRGCGANTNSEPIWFWNGDYNDGVNDNAYRELYTRWLQYATFLPMQRSHGTDTPREIWNFGQKGEMFYDSIEKYIKLRYSLMPYLYSLAGYVALYDYTILRSLMFDFKDDINVKNICNEFMFGPSILVCPVTKPMYYEVGGKAINVDKTWSCYLPQGANWYNYHTNEKFQGGQTASVAAPINILPMFIKSGSILIQASGLQYACDKSKDPLKVQIYEGNDAEFILYEDAGDGYDYEKSEYSLISFKWDDRRKELTILDRIGSFAGIEEKQAFNIILNDISKEITYDGKKMKIYF